MFGELISSTGGTDIGIHALVERDDESVIQDAHVEVSGISQTGLSPSRP
jgi:hypothetical protein